MINKDTSCILCGKSMVVHIEEYEYGGRGDEKTGYNYSTENGLNNQESCICTECLNNDALVLDILTSSCKQYISELEQRSQEIRDKYEEKIKEETKKEKKFNIGVQKIMEKLLALKSIGELEHKQIEELIYNHYDKPQVPYTRLHYLIGTIHDYQYKKVNSNKKKCDDWLEQYGIGYNGFLYSSKYFTEEEFKDYVVSELKQNEENITVSKYKEIMGLLGI